VNQELPNRLYHYCTLQGLRGIIEKKHLRMTNVFWMDDTTELFWLYEVVTRVLDRQPPDACNALHERLQMLMKDRRLSNVFCTCFSEDPDSRSQWLEYADDGHGFAIGFEPTTFDLKRTVPVRDVELQPVIYDEKEQEQIADEVIGHLQEYGNEVADNLQLFAANYNTWRQAARCKNPAFVNEREWRLIYRDDPGGGLAFRERAGRQLIPFIKFPFDPAKKPIREIWLGPRNQSQRNVDAVAQLLRVFGYEVGHIKFPGSSIPLRPEY
jgi:hypothetical protein